MLKLIRHLADTGCTVVVSTHDDRLIRGRRTYWAGLRVLSMGRALVSRTIGVVVAGLNMLFQLAWLGHFPFWSFTMIVVDILVIYGLTRRVEDYEVG